MKGWVELRTADNPAELGFYRGLLEAEGIETRARSLELWAAAVEIYFAEGARPAVWVRASDQARADAVLASIDRRGQQADWDCPSCGERLEGQFTACWRCTQADD